MKYKVKTPRARQALANMVPVLQARTDNLRLLSSQFGVRELTRKLGYASPGSLTRMLSSPPKQVVSERFARAVELRLGLTRGWMDLPRNGQTLI